MSTKLIFLLFSLSFCQSSSKIEGMELLKKVAIKVPEPSGLTFFKGELYTVSDANNSIYKLTTEGEVLKKYKTPMKDLEGIAFDENAEELYVISESKRSLYHFSLKKGIRSKQKIGGKQKGGGNKGLEGLCYDTTNKNFFVVNEADPKQLLELSKNKKKIVLKTNFDFAEDISGICYDSKLDVFWVLSDVSQAIYKVDKNGNKLGKHEISLKKPEGIAIDVVQRKLYVVSDETSEMCIYQLGN
jgi:uncharacterized protein YjiK